MSPCIARRRLRDKWENNLMCHSVNHVEINGDTVSCRIHNIARSEDDRVHDTSDNSLPPNDDDRYLSDVSSVLHLNKIVV